MTDSGQGRVRRAIRSFTLGSGPLKRRSDRVQVLGRLLVALSLLAAAPMAVVAVALTRSAMEPTAAAQAADRHPARAVVLRDTRAPTGSGSGHPQVRVVSAPVSWPGPGGTLRHGSLQVIAGVPAGFTVPVWVDRRGNLTTAPMDRAQIDGTSISVGVAALIALPLAVWGLYRVLCVVLDVLRRRRWARDWARVERQWRASLS